jgi:signal transduction histidine kinase
MSPTADLRTSLAEVRYYTVSEALTNAAKHARASSANIQVAASDGVLHVRVRDDGRGGADFSRGGADFSHGSGLVGLKDRAEALGGHLQLSSPPGAGTTLEITLPLHCPGGLGLPPGAAGPPITEAGRAG